jgi:hypothetical protein
MAEAEKVIYILYLVQSFKSKKEACPAVGHKGHMPLMKKILDTPVASTV